MDFKKTDQLLGFILFLFATSLYLYTLEPTASYWDSGEYIAAAYKLEIPHPPGAPLFLLMGRLFSFFSFGNPEMIAYSVNALSAVASGLTIMFLYWTIILFAKKYVKPDTRSNQILLIASGLIGSLAYAFSDSFWNSATETEVYALSTFLTSLVFWSILNWEKLEDVSKQNRWLILIAYLMGLSVGIHLLNLLTIPAIALVFYFKKFKNRTFWGIAMTLVISSGILLGILYGLVSAANMAKSFELFFVNSVGLPFGSGIVLFVLLGLGLWFYGIITTQKRRKINFNTALLTIGFIFIGYSSYTLVLIRANHNPPINQNNPNDVLGLIYYLNMDQYPKRPLLYGRNFDAQLIDQQQGKKVYEKGDEKYVVKDHLINNIYSPQDNTILPRMYSTFGDDHPSAYQSITGLRANEKPSFTDNMKYMLVHQMGHMYWRYFMWNFVGKEGSHQGAGWATPLNIADSVPSFLANDRSRNNYLMLPMILGLIGLFFLYQQGKKELLVLGSLFVMTGIAIVLYVNAPPIEPRERDYVYVGSYYVFCIWIGLGVIAVFNFIKEKIRFSASKSAILASVFCVSIPIIMLHQNYDDHNRSNRYYSIDQAKNMLAECEPNAILFSGGDNDTFPLWYVQEVEGFRTDVRVVVLSYANADWYINQLYRSTNESEPLPLSLEQKNYKQGGLNDYIPLIPNPKIKGAISAHQYLELIQKESEILQRQSSFHKLNTLPADSFYIINDMESVINEIPEKYQNLAANRMEFDLIGRGLEKKDLLILDMIDTNRWERPIYFNFTSLNAVNLNLNDNVILQGNTYRLLPIENPEEGQNLVDEDKMYANLMEKASWRELDNPKVYYNAFYQRAITAQRQYFNDLTEALLDSGKVQKAKNVLKKSLEAFPDESIPFDFANVNTAQLFLAVHDKDSADNIAEKLVERADEYLTYVTDHHIENQQELSRNLYTLRQLAMIYTHYGHKDQGTGYARTFEKHYAKLNG